MNPESQVADQPDEPKLTVQQLCDQLVDQFYDEFAELRRDVSTAVKEVAGVWEGHFPDPTKMHGQLYCTSVRGVLLLNRVGDVRNPEEETAAAGEVRTRYGQGMSVLILDGRGMRVRVRKAPAEFFPEQGERLVIRPPKKKPAQGTPSAVTEIRAESEADAVAVAAGQSALSPEMAALERDADEDRYEWFVLWTLSEDGLQVPDVFLAAVVDIDSPSKVIILASTSLPRKARPQQSSGKDNEFDEFFDDEGKEGMGPSGA